MIGQLEDGTVGSQTRRAASVGKAAEKVPLGQQRHRVAKSKVSELCVQL